MNGDHELDHAYDEDGGDRLRATIAPDALPVELMSAFAGDRARTEVESGRIEELQDRPGYSFFSDLLYAISHHYFGGMASAWP